jgi:hypothetical protein
MARMEDVTIAHADAQMIAGNTAEKTVEIYAEDLHFGMLNGALDSIMREYPDTEVLYVFADGAVHVWM